jgi:hypothetical protein
MLIVNSFVSLEKARLLLVKPFAQQKLTMKYMESSYGIIMFHLSLLDLSLSSTRYSLGRFLFGSFAFVCSVVVTLLAVVLLVSLVVDLVAVFDRLVEDSVAVLVAVSLVDLLVVSLEGESFIVISLLAVGHCFHGGEARESISKEGEILFLFDLPTEIGVTRTIGEYVVVPCCSFG